MKEIHRGIFGDWEEITLLDHAVGHGQFVVTDAWIDDSGMLVVSVPGAPDLAWFPKGQRARFEVEGASGGPTRLRLKRITLLGRRRG